MKKAIPVLVAGIVGAAVEQVLQVMYFCDAAYCGPASPESPAIGTALTFQGARDGVFRVVISEARATQMAADFLAVDPAEVGPDQIASTVSEFANLHAAPR